MNVVQKNISESAKFASFERSVAYNVSPMAYLYTATAQQISESESITQAQRDTAPPALLTLQIRIGQIAAVATQRSIVASVSSPIGASYCPGRSVL